MQSARLLDELLYPGCSSIDPCSLVLLNGNSSLFFVRNASIPTKKRGHVMFTALEAVILVGKLAFCPGSLQSTEWLVHVLSTS